MGVVLSSALTWDNQVSAITCKVKDVLLNLRQEAFDLPFNVRKQLIVSTVLPHLDYVCVALLGLSNKLESRLARLQNRAIRFIFHLHRRTPTTEYRCKLGWLSVRDRRTQLLAIQVYKVLTTQRPSYLYEKFESHLAKTRDGLRATSARIFDLPIPRSSTFANSFLYRGMSLWNQLTSNIRDAPSVETFRSRIYDLLFFDDN